jgi:3-oxoacyl-[acyl-carrier-protein] synthase II
MADFPRIVVTGAGVMSPLGAGLESFADALWKGASAIAESTRYPGAIVSEFQEINPTPWLGNKGVRVLDRGTRLLAIAAQMALSSTGLLQDASGDGDAGLGLVCGTMFGGVHSIASFDMSGLVEGPGFVSPMEFPNTVINAPAGQAAIKHKLRGVNSTICAGLASGLIAIQYAAEFLRFGRAKYLMAGGMEEVCDEAALAFTILGLAHDGTAAGEGSALWMLETEQTARERGAEPWFEICGFGATNHLSAEGAADAIQLALEDTGISPADIACIIAGANGSKTGDAMEARALSNVFNGRLSSIPVCAPKAAIGEVMGASGAFCAVIAGLALQRGQVPPTAGYTASGTPLKLSAAPQSFEGDYALINAFSCEGNNAALIIRRWNGNAGDLVAGGVA